MKKIFLFILSISLLSIVSCTKEETPVAPTTNSVASVFQYDNSTVEGVLEAAGYKMSGDDDVIVIKGRYKEITGDDGILTVDCLPQKDICMHLVIKRGRVNSDIIIAAPEKPIIINGRLQSVDSKGGIKKYRININKNSK